MVSTSSLSHSIEETMRKKRDTVEILSPRTASFKDFMLEGRWHLALLNERNRVEPIIFYVASEDDLPAKLPAGVNTNDFLRCRNDCSGRGECMNGVCKCAAGYTGSACEEVICPLVCSGNGVLSLGRCVCFEGFKGRECDVKEHWCEVADCHGRGRCTPKGVCDCMAGWGGDSCEIKLCPHRTCSGKGKCLEGICYCEDGWTGKTCTRNVQRSTASALSTEVQDKHDEPTHVIVEASPLSPPIPDHDRHHPHRAKAKPVAKPIDKVVVESLAPIGVNVTQPGLTEIPCNGNGLLESDGYCICSPGYEGNECETENKQAVVQTTSCQPECINGECNQGICTCQYGWKGSDCSMAECALGCEQHGRCEKNGTCLCDRGWNGANCYIEGCPRDCSGHGQCRLEGNEWHCECDTARRGADCSIPIEHSCDDGIDNDANGLIDCEDPECCSSATCSLEPTCMMAPSPNDVLLKLPSPQNAPFYQRVMFLVKPESVQSYADNTYFNESMVSVIRGRVVWNGGSPGASADLPLPGVRVSDANHPLYGFTLSRLEGAFDLLVNGGRSVQLQFLKSPFQRKKVSIYVPPNEIVYLENVILTTEKTREEDTASRFRPECLLSKRRIEPIELRTDWDVWGAPEVDGKPRLLADVGAIVDSMRIAGTDVYLVYDSRKAEATKSRLEIRLTGSNPDPSLRLVHLRIDIAGQRFTETLAARADLTHTFSWDKQNVYRQMEKGLLPTTVRIGYEYDKCHRSGEIFWVTHNVELSARSRKAVFGGWTPHIHHHYDAINGLLEKGDGTRQFLIKENLIVDLVAGADTKRELECSDCITANSTSPLYRPIAVAAGLDGSTIIGDQDLIRRLTPDGQMRTILSLSAADTSYQYSLAVSPLDGALYISMPLKKQIWKLKDYASESLEDNYEILAGDGTACASATSPCGDGGAAIDAQLLFPKGITIDTDGHLFVADGRKIRVINLATKTINALPHSLLDKSSSVACSYQHGNYLPLSEIQLEWPTSLTIDQATGALFVLDSNVVYELRRNQQIGRILLGSPSACPTNVTSLMLNHARAIAANHKGSLFVLESDEKKLNQVREYSALCGSLQPLAGKMSPCSCQQIPTHSQCRCDDEGQKEAMEAIFNNPQALMVDGKSRILVADTGNAKIKIITSAGARLDLSTSQYRIQWPSADEVYFFNRNGLHMTTRSLSTDRLLYTFSYNVNTHHGRLSQITSPGGLLLRVMWSNSDEHMVAIEAPSGLKSQLTFSPFDGSLETITLPTRESIKFTYGSGGLLKSHVSREDSIMFGYDSNGRAISISTLVGIYKTSPPRFVGDFLVVDVQKNGKKVLEMRNRPGESLITGETTQKLLVLDENAFEWSREDGVKTLYESEVPALLPGSRIVSRAKRIIGGLEKPPSRALVYRFDRRPFIATNGQTRRVAEVGIRPRVNGVNVYSVYYDKLSNRDILRKKGDEPLLQISYGESGKCKMIEAAKGLGIAAMNISHDEFGRINEITWGSIRRQFAYDRQNRLIEMNWGPGENPKKFTYTKDFPLPTTVDESNGGRYAIKLNTHGLLQQIITPTEEMHQFSTATVPQGILLKRRKPEWKTAAKLLSDDNGNLLEYLAPDKMHYLRIQRDTFGRPDAIFMEEKLETKMRYERQHLASVIGRGYSRHFVRQGELALEIVESRSFPYNSGNVTFTMGYDDLGRATSIYSKFDGKQLDAINLKYDRSTGLVDGMAGFTIQKIGETQKIFGHEIEINSAHDQNGALISRNVIAGQKGCHLAIIRDSHGRQISTEWKRGDEKSTEEFIYDAAGSISGFVGGNNQRWEYKYDKEGRVVSINDETVEYGVGGVPRKVGSLAYQTDSNGWTVKRGKITFKYDALGRLVNANEENGRRVSIEYDENNRVIGLEKDGARQMFYYAWPQLSNHISHTADNKGNVKTFLYTESGVLYAILDGDEWIAVLTDATNSPRCFLGANRPMKVIDRGLFGAPSAINDQFTIPVGHLGGIDIPEMGVVILNGRPLDTKIGRWMSFGPNELKLPRTLLDARTVVDPFTLSESQMPSASLTLPTQDLMSWLSLIGVSPIMFAAPPAFLAPEISINTPVISAELSGFTGRLKALGQINSVGQSALVEKVPEATRVATTRDDPGFGDLIFIVTANRKVQIEPSPKLTAEEQKFLFDLFADTEEVQWPLAEEGWARHFATSGKLPGIFVSESHRHFTAVVGADTVELRAGKTKIFVYFDTNKDAVRSKLADELRRQEAHHVWKLEKKMLERGLKTRRNWSEAEKSELLRHGSVSGYSVEPQPTSTLMSAQHWIFLKQQT
ncbi:unnamed protein product, partial [Mesorhabditis spiculigera]